MSKERKVHKKRSNQPNKQNNKNIEDPDLKDLKDKFAKYSSNGKMKKTQFSDLMGILGLDSVSFLSDRIFKFYSKNNKYLQWDEFFKFIDTVQSGNQEQQMRFSFGLFDLNNSGKVSFEEFKSTFQDIMTLWFSISGSTIFTDNEVIKFIFDQIDKNKDGFISFDEYRDYFSDDLNSFEWFNILNAGVIKIPTPVVSIQLSHPDSNLKEQERINQKNTENINNIKEEINNIIDTIQTLKTDEFIAPENEEQNFSKTTLENEGTRTLIKLLQTPEEFENPEDILDADISPLKVEKNNEEEMKDKKFKMSNFHSVLCKARKSIESVKIFSSPLNKKIGDEDPEIQEEYDLNEGEVKRKLYLEKKNYTQTFASPQGLSMKKNNSLFNDLSMIKDSPSKTTTNYLNVANKNELIERLMGMRQTISTITSIKLENVRKEEVKKEIVVPKIEREKIDVFFPDKSRKFINLMDDHWNFILNMMIGIRKSVIGVTKENFEPKSKDYLKKFSYDLISKKTKQMKGKIYQFYDYAPEVFHCIRRNAGISPQEYLRSIGPEQLIGNLLKGNLMSLQEQISSGRSGSIFFYSWCGRFLIKTLHRDEFKVFKTMLHDYYSYLKQYPNCLINKIFGLHKINANNTKYYINIMNNVFNVKRELSVSYDLKGSEAQRKVRKNKDEKISKNKILKDLDFIDDNNKVKIHPMIRDRLINQINDDSAFLSKHNLLDYSLILGIHNLNPDNEEGTKFAVDFCDFLTKVEDIKNYPNLFKMADGGILSSSTQQIYYFGIIDVFTEYRAKKEI